jgi:Na+/serine symporter
LWSANFASSVTMPTGATLNLTGLSLTITTAS